MFMERLNESTKLMIQRLQEFGLVSEVNLESIEDNKSLYNYLKTVESKLDEDLSTFNIKQDLKEHMEELHKYNVMKDATQSLLGSLSSQTGQSVTELHKQFGVKGSHSIELILHKNNMGAEYAGLLQQGKQKRKAIALLEEEQVSKEEHFGGRKSVRECQLPSLQAHNLCSAAEIFTGGDNLTRQMLEELRMSFLENNYSAAAKLLEWVLKRATKPELPILWRSAVVLFLNEDCSNEKLLDEFLEMCADQRVPEAKQQLIKLLVSLPDPEMLASRTKRLSRKEGSEVTDSRSITENEDPDDPDFIF